MHRTIVLPATGRSRRILSPSTFGYTLSRGPSFSPETRMALPTDRSCRIWWAGGNRGRDPAGVSRAPPPHDHDRRDRGLDLHEAASRVDRRAGGGLPRLAARWMAGVGRANSVLPSTVWPPDARLGLWLLLSCPFPGRRSHPPWCPRRRRRVAAPHDAPTRTLHPHDTDGPRPWHSERSSWSDFSTSTQRGW
jgi:hypothetical protein